MHQVVIGILLALTASASSDIHVIDVPTGALLELNQTFNCVAYHALLNYKRAMLSILPTDTLEEVMWTNIKLDNYDTDGLPECPRASVVCGKASGHTTTTAYINTCVDDLYVYVLDTAHARTDKKNLMLSITYEEKAKACDSVVENDYTMCGAKNERDCDLCEGPCRWALCRAVKTNSVQGTLCLPANTTKEEILTRCKEFAHNENGDWKRDCDDTVITGDIGGLYGFISGVLILAFLTLFLSVFWYNFRLKRTGHAPLHCPRFCPDMLYPRERTEPRQEERASGYQPPEFYSDH